MSETQIMPDFSNEKWFENYAIKEAQKVNMPGYFPIDKTSNTIRFTLPAIQADGEMTHRCYGVDVEIQYKFDEENDVYVFEAMRVAGSMSDSTYFSANNQSEPDDNKVAEAILQRLIQVHANYKRPETGDDAKIIQLK